MAGKKENLKALFTNTRSRVIIVFTAILLIVAVVVGITQFIKSGNRSAPPSDVPISPGIQSIPGAIDPTVQYAKLVEAQNVGQAQSALKTGSSAIPTIVRSQELGSGVQVVGGAAGQGGLGFSGLAREDEAGLQRSAWIQELKNSSCSKAAVNKVVTEGASLVDLKNSCTCVQLKDNGYPVANLQQVCSCQELKAAGFNARQLKDSGYTAGRLRLCGYDACELRSAGLSAQEMKDGGYSDGELKGAGFTDADIARASGLPDNVTDADVRNAGCQAAALAKLRVAGVTASAVRRISGCTAAQLKAAGYTAQDLKNAGYTAADLKNAGFAPGELHQAGFSARDLLNAGLTSADLANAGFTPQQIAAVSGDDAIGAAGRATDCSVSSLTAARKAGVSATTIRETLGCSAAAMKAAGYTAAELRAAGFTAAELKNAGFTAAELKAAGFSAKELRDAGFTAQQLKDAGFTAAQLKDAGFSAAELKAAGFTASQLKAAGFSAKDLKDAGFSAGDLRAAGFNAKDLKDAGFSAGELRAAGFIPADLHDAGYSAEQLKRAGFSTAELASAGINSSQVAGLGSPDQLQGAVSTMPTIPGYQSKATQTNAAEAGNSQQLQDIMKRQTQQLADQKYQQKIQQRTSEMLSVANQSLQNWKKVSTQVYIRGTEEVKKDAPGVIVDSQTGVVTQNGMVSTGAPQRALIKTGDILFGVIDTSINSDEPGPILATIVSGRLKGAKLIGSFNLPTNANKMVISFTTMSVPGASKSVSISAYAIDADTARTALSSHTNHHYLLRYGSLFASSFLEGFGNAFQSADTTVTVGGSGGGDNITVQNGIGRSALENAVIGLATVGKSWGQVAQQQFNTPTTVEVYSGTGVGILFTQDLTSL
ncbi:MAG: type IVB secretion system protein DotG/IcmE [Legionella sp.]|nr:type IVB secretion system protein DotG/IcmE [Legionella sp.]